MTELQVVYDAFLGKMLEDEWLNWDLEEIEIPLHAEKRTGKYSADKVKPWNQWNKDEYMAFRKSVHNSIECPLDWEGPVWIEVAKSRASK